MITITDPSCDSCMWASPDMQDTPTIICEKHYVKCGCFFTCEDYEPRELQERISREEPK